MRQLKPLQLLQNHLSILVRSLKTHRDLNSVYDARNVREDSIRFLGAVEAALPFLRKQELELRELKRENAKLNKLLSKGNKKYEL